MSYTVIWPEPIRRRILRYYERTVQGDGRETAELNAALAMIEDAFQHAPGQAGESRDFPRRVIIVSPLCVDFVADESAQLVRVVDVHYSRGRRT